MKTLFPYHFFKALACLLLLAIAKLLVWHFGIAKPLAIYDWYDIAAEGSVVVITYAWLFIILRYRPEGRVTNLLFLGCLLMAFSFTMDFMDEFFSYGINKQLMTIFEAGPAPIGMVLLSVGMAGWLTEQKMIYRQLQSRELYLRDHQLLDPLTKLYNADYLQQILEREYQLYLQHNKPCSLLVLDINDFSAYNQRQGAAKADQLLQTTAELLLSQLRSTDVLCRYAADRFMAILPQTSLAEAAMLETHLHRQQQQLSTTWPRLTMRSVRLDATSQPAPALIQAANVAISRKPAASVLQWQTV